MVRCDLLDRLDVKLLELADSEIFDVAKGPSMSEFEDAEPCFDGCIVKRIMAGITRVSRDSNSETVRTGYISPRGNARSPHSSRRRG